MEILKPYRARIDALDDKIVDLLVERAGIIREVAHLKYEHDIPAILQDRVDQVRERNAENAGSRGVDAETVRRIYAILIDYSCRLEDSVMDNLRAEEKRSGKGV